jgi:TM2 domain-containing membrane protein YozV
MTLIAILFPSLPFLLRGKIITGIICFLLQIILIGWIPASIWAVVSLQNNRADKRNDKLIKAMKQ